MHNIDPNWTDLLEGYQAVQSLNARLEIEFGHAFQAAQKQKFRGEFAEWQKKRRVFIILAVIAPLSIITLCLTAYFRRDVACVVIYWVLLVAIILVTLGVAGRNTIREAMNRPKLDGPKKLPLDLELRWWESLAPQDMEELDAGEKEKETFLAVLGKSLHNTILATRSPSPLVFTAAGIWLFQLVSWSGTIVREDETWKHSQSVKDEPDGEQAKAQEQKPAPDEEWIQQRNDLIHTLKDRLPKAAWTTNLIQGGVVFTHPKANLDKARIQGNLAAYGLTKAWEKRLTNAPEVHDFGLEIQLEILDSLHANKTGRTISAKELAETLYQQAVEELWQSITGMVK